MKSLQARMKEKAKFFKKAKERAKEQGEFTELPDGRYIGQLVAAEVGESKSSGRLQVSWQYKISDGEYKGETKYDFNGIEDEDQQSFLVSKLTRFGIDLDSLEELPEALKELVKTKPMVRFKLVTKGEFQNLRIDKVLDESDAAEVEEAGEEEETEETEGEEEETETEEEEGESVELTIGSKVTFKFKGKDRSGTIKDVSDDGETVDILTDDTKKIAKNVSVEDITPVAEEEEETEEEAEEETEEEGEEESTELSIGSKVSFTFKGKKRTGVIKDVSDEGDTVDILADDTKKIVKGVPVEDLEAVEEEAEEEEEDVPEEPAVKPKVTKVTPTKTKAAPKPVKKIAAKKKGKK